jgi:hypothetical protein
MVHQRFGQSVNRRRSQPGSRNPNPNRRSRPTRTRDRPGSAGWSLPGRCWKRETSSGTPRPPSRRLECRSSLTPNRRRRAGQAAAAASRKRRPRFRSLLAPHRPPRRQPQHNLAPRYLVKLQALTAKPCKRSGDRERPMSELRHPRPSSGRPLRRASGLPRQRRPQASSRRPRQRERRPRRNEPGGPLRPCRRRHLPQARTRSRPAFRMLHSAQRLASPPLRQPLPAGLMSARPPHRYARRLRPRQCPPHARAPDRKRHQWQRERQGRESPRLPCSAGANRRHRKDRRRGLPP